MNLTDKETVELRIKCIEPFIAVASKHDIDKDLLVAKAEKVWDYAIEPLSNDNKSKPGKPNGK